MKIGFDAKRLYNNLTGLGNYSRTLVGNLMRQFPANEYYLYTPSRRLPAVEGATTVVPTSHKRTWRARGIIKNLESDGIELYHGLSHDLPFGIHRSGIRTVVTIHDVCFLTYPAMFPLVERLIYAFKYHYTCRRADAIVAISESTKADIVRFFGVDPARIEVIYQSINPIFYTPQSNPYLTLSVLKNIPERYILSVGAINARKNLLGIVEAYALVAPELRLPLVIVGGGGGKYRAKVEARAAELGIAGDIVWMGTVAEDYMIQALYQCAEMLLYPSFYEGFGLPVAEALLSGVPVVTSAVSSLPEAGGDAALYVDPNEPLQIAQAITNILTDSILRARMVARGVEYATAKFDVEKLTAQMEELYCRVKQ